MRWFELLLVITIAIADPLFKGLYFLKHGPSPGILFDNSRWTYGLIHEIICLLLLGYVLSRRSLRIRDLGLRWSLRACSTGFFLAIAFMIASATANLLLRRLHLAWFGFIDNSPTAKDFFAHPSFMAIPFTLFNPFFEELIVRAYLMTELLELTGSSLLAVVCSTAVQFSYHLYYGWVGALSISTGFLVFSLYYLRARRATPVIVAHGFIDILGFIRLWWFG